jgi:CheY-like chemotaxis protein
MTLDDEDAFQYVLREMLNGSGYDVMQAESGREGLRLMHELPPDILLLDWHLSDMSGVQVLDRLRQDSRTADLPVILVTSQRLSADELRNAGDPPLLSKSALTRDALQSAIRRTIDLTRSAEPGS